MVKFGLWWREDDAGTKEACQKAYKRLSKEAKKEFFAACREYWMYVYELARRLCIEYGAIDTWSLYETIRIIWELEPSGGLYEVAVSATGVDMVAMIKVGGTLAINPKTGWFVDYAQIVHDGGPHPSGGGYFKSRPFLTNAIIQSQVMFEVIFSKHLDRALTNFTRDY